MVDLDTNFIVGALLIGISAVSYFLGKWKEEIKQLDSIEHTITYLSDNGFIRTKKNPENGETELVKLNGDIN
tara:strand:+ start:336 stop:551 length:216 start_codon:yes stop_codon:yes gene_type:complete